MDGGRGDRFRTRWERDAQCSPVQPLSAMGPFPAKSSKTAPVGSGSRVQTNPHKLKTLRALAPVSGSVQPLGPSQVWREGGSVQCAVCSPGKLTRELCVRRSWCARGHTHLFVHTHIWIGFGRGWRKNAVQRGSRSSSTTYQRGGLDKSRTLPTSHSTTWHHVQARGKVPICRFAWGRVHQKSRSKSRCKKQQPP